jgi:hypothetical protein
MDTLTELILTTVVCLVAPLVIVCLPLLSRVCGTEIESESSLFGFQNAPGRRFDADPNGTGDDKDSRGSR